MNNRQQIPQLGLHLALADQTNFSPSTFFSEDLDALINNEKTEIQQCFINQSERLRRTLQERHEQLYRTLMQSAGKRLYEKELEIKRAGRFLSELENRLSRIQSESAAWQTKALLEQSTAASLHAQLQKAAAAVVPDCEERCGVSPAEDALSSCVDLSRADKLERPCRACFSRPAVVVLLPCCHLCLCVFCDFVSAVGDSCPACRCFRTGSLHVSFS